MPRLIMLPAVFLAAWIGTAYILGEPIRTATPAFGAAKALAPIELWGVVFLTGAFALAVATVSGRTRWMAAALLVGGGIYTWWGSLFAFTAITDPHASLNGGALYAFIAAVHFFGAWLWRVKHP